MKNSSNLGTRLLSDLDSQGYYLQLVGLVNIEGGTMSIATKLLDYCEDCEGLDPEHLFRVNCKTCLRDNTNYLWIKSGDGDGLYPILTLRTKADQIAGVLVIFDSNYELSKPLAEATIASESNNFEIKIFANYFDNNYFDLGSIDFQGEGILFSDSLWSTNSRDAAVKLDFSDLIPSLKFKCFAQNPNSRQDLFPTLNSPKPKMVIGLNNDLTEKFFTAPEIDVSNEAQILEEWLFTGMAASHVERMNEVAIWFNYQISASIGDLPTAISWLLQGVVNNDIDCIEEINNYEIPTIEIKQLLLERGLTEAADKYNPNQSDYFDVSHLA